MSIFLRALSLYIQGLHVISFSSSLVNEKLGQRLRVMSSVQNVSNPNPPRDYWVKNPLLWLLKMAHFKIIQIINFTLRIIKY
jgi:hypothetical protein